MDIKTALNIKEAFILLEKELNVPIQKLGSLIHLYNEDCYKKLQEASVLWNKFNHANIVERGKMLGLTININSE